MGAIIKHIFPIIAILYVTPIKQEGGISFLGWGTTTLTLCLGLTWSLIMHRCMVGMRVSSGIR